MGISDDIHGLAGHLGFDMAWQPMRSIELNDSATPASFRRPSEPVIDDRCWAERSEYWKEHPRLKARQLPNRPQIRQPLILSGHGVRIRVDHGALVVTNGLTHYPQQREEWRFFSGDWRLPSRIILLDVDGGISFDALSWLAARDIPLVQINWDGAVRNIIGGSATAVNTVLAKRQLAARGDERRIHISRGLIAQKLANSIITLTEAFPTSPKVNTALNKLEAELRRLRREPPVTISALLGVEGRAAYAYFSAWHSQPLRWRNTKRHPIPNDWHAIGRRTSKVAKRTNPNRRATHPLSAMLNYAYGALANQVRMHVVGVGLDPALGFFHGNYVRRREPEPALVHDLMEPLRPIVDRAVLRFVREETLAPGDFVLLNNGVCRLNPHLARNVVRAIDLSDYVGKAVNGLVSKLNKRVTRVQAEILPSPSWNKSP